MPQSRTSMLRNEYFLQAAILLFVVFVLFPGAFLRGDVSVPGSILYERFPFKPYTPSDWQVAENSITSEILIVFNNYNLLATRAFSMGEWPLWNDLQMTGAPLLANYQSTVLYPPKLLFRIFEHYFATTLFYMLKLWLCGATAYIFARGHGFGIPASRLVSIGWMLSMFNMSWWYLPITDVSAWVPLLLLGVEWILEARYRRGIFTGALGATLLLLGGHPESSFAFALGVGAYFFLRLLLDRRRGAKLWKPLGACSILWAIAIGACMAQLLPFAEYLVHSETFNQRAAGLERRPFVRENTSIAMWIPRFYGFTADDNVWVEQEVLDNSNYISLVYAGMGVWIAIAALMASGPVTRKEWCRRIALGVPTLVAFLLGYGVPIVRPVLDLPVFSSMWPMHHISFGMFALPVLAAMGVEHWSRSPRTKLDFLFPVGLLILIASGACMVYAWRYGDIARAGMSQYVIRQIVIAVAFGAVSIGILYAHAFFKRSALLLHLLWIVLAIDLFVACHDMRPVESRLHLFPDTRLTTYLQNQPKPYRVCISTGPRFTASVRLGILLPYGVEEAWGYDGIYPDRVTRFYEEIRAQQWGKLEPILAIDQYIPPPEDRTFDSVNLKLIGIIDNLGLWDNPNALPRARLVGKVITAPDAGGVFDTMMQPEFDPAVAAVTERPPDAPLPGTSNTDLGSAHVTDHTTLTATIAVEAKEDCALIFAEQWFPGWKAYIDGQETELWPAYYCMRGVLVPEGAHVVQFRYEPLSLALGLGLSVAVLVVSGIVSLVLLIRKQPNVSTA
ncbi:MAG: hypothetical protein SGI88_12840 [Candidatus Hydrogenedentes bacterium]|nr:hypothetical protein [Candidatus Hydrogenedentota bacterium]